MKNIKKAVFTLSFVPLVALTSCIFSLFPIYTDETIVHRSEFIGEWGEGNKDETNIRIELLRYEMLYPNDEGEMVPTKFDLKEKPELNPAANMGSEEFEDSIREFQNSVRYKLTAWDEEDSLAFVVTLVEIGKYLYMDVFPFEEFDKVLADNLFPVHSFNRVEIRENELVLTEFDAKLVDLFESNRIRLRHENMDGLILITAKPKEVQKFLQNYAEKDEVFSDPDVYQRVVR